MLDSITSEGIEVQDARVEYVAKTKIKLNDEDYKSAEKITQLLLEHEDVDDMYASYEQTEQES